MGENVYSRLAEIAAGFQEPTALDRWGVRPTVDRDDRFLELNAVALTEARGLLSRPCYVEVEYEYSFLARHIGPQSELARLGTALCMQFHERQRADDFAACARIGLDVLRAAQGARCGGLVTDALTSAATEGGAVNLLRRIRGRFAPEEAVALAAEILQLEETREPFAAIQARDDEWERRVEHPPPSELPPREPMQWSDEDIAELGVEKLREFEAEMNKFVAALANRPPQESRADYLRTDLSRLALRRLLTVELAAQAHFTRCGRRPAAIKALIPEYLAAEPLDPFSNQSFRLRTQPTYAAYSVGPYNVDFGGMLGSYWAAMMYKCNFGVDSFDYESGDHDPPLQRSAMTLWKKFFARLFPCYFRRTSRRE